jgi:hypothetical protein
MAYKIIGEITQRNFELVRNRLAVILFDEMERQDYVSTDPLFEKPTIYVEGNQSFDANEHPIINVMLQRGDYESKDVIQADGVYLYNIDIHTKAKETSTDNADTLAMLRCQRLLGVCQAIFENPAYKTLDYAPGTIEHVKVNGISIGETSEGDAESTSRARLILEVSVPEGNELKIAGDILGYSTVATLGLTSKGHVFSLVDLENEVGDGLLLGTGGGFLLLGSTGKLLLG